MAHRLNFISIFFFRNLIGTISDYSFRSSVDLWATIHSLWWVECNQAAASVSNQYPHENMYFSLKVIFLNGTSERWRVKDVCTLCSEIDPNRQHLSSTVARKSERWCWLPVDRHINVRLAEVATHLHFRRAITNEPQMQTNGRICSKTVFSL